MFTNKIHEKAHEALKAGNVDEAIWCYTLALEENPNDCDILSDRGVAFLHLNDEQKCFEDLNLSLKLQPDYAYRYASRAYAKKHFGDLDGAIKDYEKAVELDPDDAVAQNNLGLLLEQKGYANEAKNRFARADKLSKLEDELYQVIDDLETGDDRAPAEPEKPKTVEKNEARPEIDPAEQQEKRTTKLGEFLKLFTSKRQFKEFINFIKNGFKIK
ncbi:MAG: tetratricopeptide repeat protein [Crocinitomicaceae bacterium]|nr:tetratricopeptide repeat protein [Crocinitomicaceae bacterium]